MLLYALPATLLSLRRSSKQVEKGDDEDDDDDGLLLHIAAAPLESVRDYILVKLSDIFFLCRMQQTAHHAPPPLGTGAPRCGYVREARRNSRAWCRLGQPTNTERK